MTFKNCVLDQPFSLYFKEEMHSTNDVAVDLAQKNYPHATVVTCDHQTHGKGRIKRQWISQKGDFQCSLILYPQIPLERWGEISFVICLSMIKALEQVCGDGVKIQAKWPNDILINRLKVSGILVQSCPQDGWAVAGIGVNMKKMSDKVNFSYTTIESCCNKKIDLCDFIKIYLNYFLDFWGKWHQEGFEFIRLCWLKYCCHVQQSVLVCLPSGQKIQGIFYDMDQQGALILKKDHASQPYDRITVADVHLIDKVE